MSARPPQHRAVTVVALLLVAAVAPWVATSPVAVAAGASASFSPAVVYEERGDVATITVSTSDGGVVNIGKPSKAFWMQVRVGGGSTTLKLNTYQAGLASTEAELKRALSGGTVLEAEPTPVHKPLAAAKYSLNVTKDGRELGIGGLVIEERATRSIEARIAPGSTELGDRSKPSALRSATQQPWGNGSVASGDWVVFHVNATGLSGMLSKDRLDDGGEVEMTFEEQTGEMNANPNEFTGEDAEQFVAAEEGFYVVFDTEEHDIEPGDRYTVSFVVRGDGNLAENREVVSTSLRVVSRRVTVERNGPGDTIVVDGKTTISGTTTLTPGTEIDVVARDAELPPFHHTRTVTVANDRTFSATFDFSGLEPGREFDFRLPDQGRTIPGVVAGATTTTTTTATATTTTTTTTTTVTTTTTATSTTKPNATTTKTTATTRTTAEGLTQVAIGGVEPTLTQQAEQNGTDGGGSSGPVPGFGPAAGLLALVAGLVLALRRR